MSTLRAEPGWADVLLDHAAEPDTADRLIRQLNAASVASLAFCRLLERWGRGDAAPSTPGGRQAALRRAADRAETALSGLERPARAVPARARARARRGTLLVRRSRRGRADRVGAGAPPRGRALLVGAGRPGLPRARGLPAGAGRASTTPRGSAWRPTAPRSGPASSTCARTCSAGPWTTCARLPPELDSRRLGQPRPGRALRAAAAGGGDADRRHLRPLSGRQGREPGGRGSSARGARQLRRRGRRGRLRRRGARRDARSRGRASSSRWATRPAWR